MATIRSDQENLRLKPVTLADHKKGSLIQATNRHMLARREEKVIVQLRFPMIPDQHN
ncbi:hypothetical protein [Acidithiobacillus thiooxidans]|jgi:hypothetical protein|uniref:hypothetical protein n=1 Tax=Acidithiobacillus thiooxidans TaxID=930 RepID=UPI003566FD48